MRVDQVLTEAELLELGRLLGRAGRGLGGVLGWGVGKAADVAGSVAGIGSAFKQGYRAGLSPKPRVAPAPAAASTPKEPSLFSKRFQQAKDNVANPGGEDTRIEPTVPPVSANKVKPPSNVKVNYYGHTDNTSNVQAKPAPVQGINNVKIDPITGKPVDAKTKPVPIKSMNVQIDPATGRYVNQPSESLERLISLSKQR